MGQSMLRLSREHILRHQQERAPLMRRLMQRLSRSSGDEDTGSQGDEVIHLWVGDLLVAWRKLSEPFVETGRSVETMVAASELGWELGFERRLPQERAKLPDSFHRAAGGFDKEMLRCKAEVMHEIGRCISLALTRFESSRLLRVNAVDVSLAPGEAVEPPRLVWSQMELDPAAPVRRKLMVSLELGLNPVLVARMTREGEQTAWQWVAGVLSSQEMGAIRKLSAFEWLCMGIVKGVVGRVVWDLEWHHRVLSQANNDEIRADLSRRLLVHPKPTYTEATGAEFRVTCEYFAESID